jgi:hypothetical protein
MSKKIILSAFEKLSIEEKEDLLGKLVSRYTKSLEANTSGDLPQDQSDSIVNTLETENISFLEQQRKSQALQFLKDNNLETPAHIAMINNIQFTKEAIVIGGVTRAHENAKASDFGLNYTIDHENNPADYNKAHVFKGEGDYAEEDYFNYAMVDKIAKQEAKVPTYQDMRKTLAALPGGPSGTLPNPPSSIGRDKWSAKLMSILLGAEMSGCRGGGVWEDIGSYGFLWSRSESGSGGAWAYEWVEAGGRLDRYYREYARPLRLLA